MDFTRRVLWYTCSLPPKSFIIYPRLKFFSLLTNRIIFLSKLCSNSCNWSNYMKWTNRQINLQIFNNPLSNLNKSKMFLQKILKLWLNEKKTTNRTKCCCIKLISKEELKSSSVRTWFLRFFKQKYFYNFLVILCFFW